MDTMIRSWTSANGRYGVQIVGGEAAAAAYAAAKAAGTPAAIAGHLVPLGGAGGRTCFRLVAEPGTTYVVLEDDAEAIEGCGAAVVHAEGLQSGAAVTLLHVVVGAVWRRRGYKGRSVQYRMLGPDGVVVEAQPALLLAAGVLTPAEPPPPAPPPAPFSSQMAAALRAAGVIK